MRPQPEITVLGVPGEVGGQDKISGGDLRMVVAIGKFLVAANLQGERDREPSPAGRLRAIQTVLRQLSDDRRGQGSLSRCQFLAVDRRPAAVWVAAMA